jgi:hypothetical protein
MKILKWADEIKEKVETKEEILRKVERAEIITLVISAITGAFSGIGVVFIIMTPSGSKAAWLGMVMFIAGGITWLEYVIKGYLKLERYKRLWDKMEQMQGEERKMQAEDI